MLWAQPNVGGRPLSEKFADHLTPHQLLSVHLIAKPDKSLFRASDVANQVAVGVKAGLTLNNSGLWEQLPNGDRVWRLVVRIPEALGLVALYDRFIIPAGALLYVTNADKSVVWGGFTSANNPDPTSGYSTAMIAGETTVFEYYEPASARGQGQISIDKFSYFYEPAIKNDSEYQRQQYIQYKATQFGRSATCNINVNCSTDIGANWQQEKRAVAKILIISSSGGAGFCSGSLVNNTALDEKAYFYSAFHCQAGGVNYDQTQFHFNYESPGCSNQDVTPDIVVGGTVRMTLREADTWLTELKGLPPNPYFAGWNREDKSPGRCIGISHPAGDIKKITEFSAAISAPDVNIGGYVVPNNSHWGLNITKGYSEGGSSGSPLFGIESRLIHGTLHGGSGNCTNGIGTGTSYYGKFSWAWANGGSSSSRLRDWLDPLNKEFLELPGLDPNEANPNVIISEIASGVIDGKPVRYIELYNAHPDRKMKLNALNLRILVDGSSSNQRSIALPAFDLLPGQTYVVANTAFDTAWKLPAPNLIADGLGDGNDVYEMVSASRSDSYGERGKNGTGLFWDYTNKVVSRRPNVVKPNASNFSTLNFHEWQVSELTLSNMTPGKHTAQQPQVDLTITEVINPTDGGLSCDGKISPVIKVANNGKNAVSSYQLSVKIGSKTATITNDRPLNPEGEEIFDFSSTNEFFDVAQNQQFELLSRVSVTQTPADQVSVNDSVQVSVKLGNKSGVFLIVELQTDNKPQESKWEILSQDKVIYSRDFTGLKANTLYTSRLCLDTALCYTFRLTDKGGNGIASPGFARATIEGSDEPLIPNANFSASRNANFCMIAIPEIPSDCQATVLPGNIVRFSWKDNSALENGFVLQRQFTDLVPAVWENLTEVSQNQTFYDDILSPSQARRKVSYRVASYRNSQDGRRVVSKYCEMKGDLVSIDQSLQYSLLVYPNPASTSLTIQTDDAGQLRLVRIYDVLGKLVLQSDSNANEFTVDIANLSAGIYSLNVQTDFGQQTVRFVKE